VKNNKLILSQYRYLSRVWLQNATTTRIVCDNVSKLNPAFKVFMKLDIPMKLV
jgi:hypothetical protein